VFKGEPQAIASIRILEVGVSTKNLLSHFNYFLENTEYHRRSLFKERKRKGSRARRKGLPNSSRRAVLTETYFPMNVAGKGGAAQEYRNDKNDSHIFPYS